MPDRAMAGKDRTLLESNTHSFIVKVWLEDTVEEAGRATWRGHITHVPGGERRYLSDLDDISAFIMPYLSDMGAKPETVAQRLRSWTARLWRTWR